MRTGKKNIMKHVITKLFSKRQSILPINTQVTRKINLLSDPAILVWFACLFVWLVCAYLYDYTMFAPTVGSRAKR